MEISRGEYVLSDDKSRLDLEVVTGLLRSTYWAADRTQQQVAQSIQNSVCFGIYRGGRQVGFARAVTDCVTFCYLCDVVIDPEHRGSGLGKWVVETMLSHPDLQTTTQCLRTRDAHSLYERFGFVPTEYLRRSTADWTPPAP